MGPRLRRPLLTGGLAAVLAAGLMAVPSADLTGTAATSTSYSGSTSDGGVWVADVPSSWNGIILLYSHGFGPPVAADAPSPDARQALLGLGYALVGSSYDPHGSWWALGSALTDQFQALAGLEARLPARPRHVIAVGTSMGGLISALEAENAHGRLDGALTTCGLVAGAIQLNNYQLDGEYAMTRLLAPGQSLRLVDFSSPQDGLDTGLALSAIAARAQGSAAGRARLALAMALLNVFDWAPGQPMPGVHDYDAQEQGQYQVEFGGSSNAMDFTEFARPYIEEAAGGNGSWTVGVDFARLLDHSSYAPEVRALYREAGLDLDADLDRLTAGASIRASTGAIEWLQRTSVPTGRLQVPELDVHTISDQLVPVQQENDYLDTVQRAGRRELLRQAFVARQGHCNFTTAELVAGVLALQHRVETGRWDDVAEPEKLEAQAVGLGLGNAAFIRYRPPSLSGNNGPFIPFLDGGGS